MLPTAVQAVGVLHDTAARTLPPWPTPGVGVLCVVQVAPSHRSDRAPLADAPTAIQASAEVHETARSWFWPKAAGLKGVWTLQAVPS